MNGSRQLWRRQRFEKLVKDVWRLGFIWGVKFIRINVAETLRERGQDDLARVIETIDWDAEIEDEQRRIRAEIFSRADIDLAKLSYELTR